MSSVNWLEWHEQYSDADSPAARRLTIIQDEIAKVLGERPPGPIHMLSLCAGDGRDILGVLAHHPRREDVRGRLIELDETLAARAREHASAIGATGVEVVTGDAGTRSAFADAAPVDLLLLCGVFGNISDDDINRTIDALPGLCRSGSTVIWTRHRRPPDATPSIRARLQQRAFVEVAFHAPEVRGSNGHSRWSWIGVGVYRFAGITEASPDGRLFTFTDRR